MRVGVLALQGDFEAHARMMERLGAAWTYIRRPEELKTVDALIIPGGESTTFMKFLEQHGFIEALRRLPEQRKPVFGTCAGAILLAKEVTNPPQSSLGLVDVGVERNAYGRQVSSAVRQGHSVLADGPMEMVFIRAPAIRRIGKGVRVVAQCGEEPVSVEQDQCLLSTFHPELTSDTTMHQHFLHMVGKG